MLFRIFVLLLLSLPLSLRADQVPLEVSEPQGVTVSIYDTGIGMVSEARRVVLGQGEATLRIGALPARIDPASMTLGSAARALPFDVLEQTLLDDLSSTASLLQRLTGHPVALSAAGDRREGILVGGLREEAGTTVLPVRAKEGDALWLIPADALAGLTFSSGKADLATEPHALWRVRSRAEGPQSFRLNYRVDGLAWRAYYDLVLATTSPQADLTARVELRNGAGGRFQEARVRLLTSERGLAGPLLPDPNLSIAPNRAQRFAYGADRPSLERSVAALAPVTAYELPRTVNLEPERSVYVQMLQVAAIPVNRYFVYDGVRFDRFQRNPRTDWNYGTEFHPTVMLHVEFENAEKYGLGINLPPGICRLYTTGTDGTIDLAGEELLLPVAVGGTGSVRVGPGLGLRGERERTSYAEIRPNQVYEESFQIRLMNASDAMADMRVVEHLYRGNEFEIIRADAEYEKTGPQTIEFRMELEPASRRAVNYTVRYTW